MFIKTFVVCVVYISAVKAAAVGSIDKNGDYNVGLDKLGPKQNVELDLQAVGALALNRKMITGIGGITIMTLQPSGKQFLVKQSALFECPKPISEDGKCDGDLKQFHFKNKEDFCFMNVQSQTNDHICLSEGPTSFTVYNNNYTCKALDENMPALLITVDDFKKMCESNAKEIVYKYIADNSNPEHVEIPNSNPNIKCSNKEDGICVFTDKRDFKGAGNINISSDTSNLHISGGSDVHIGN